jgi:hypothetical protein
VPSAVSVRGLSVRRGANTTSTISVVLPDPPVLVLDEPTVGLDPVSRVELWALFRRLADAGAVARANRREHRRGRLPGARGAPVSARRTAAVARRVLTQLRHDPRMLAVPALLMLIVKGVFAGRRPYAYDALARAACGPLGGRGALDLAVLAGGTLLALPLGAATLRRRTA